MIEKRLSLDNIPNGVTYVKITATEKSTFDSKQNTIVPQAHIIDANGTIEDITTKFNTLLAQLEALGILAGN